MVLILISLLLFSGGGLCAALAGRRKTACLVGALSAMAASLAGIIPAVHSLAAKILGSPTSFYLDLGPLPLGRALLGLDPLAAFFLIPVLLLSGLCAVYGLGYSLRLDEHAPRQHHLGAQWFFFNHLSAGMLLMICARDAFLFLLAWEIMSLAPFFLVSLHDEEQKVRSASWIYLVAAHLGALCLLTMFGLLAAEAGDSLNFADFEAAGGLALGVGGSGLPFLLAVLGFGTKAGLMPMHVWLPEAHPVAPSHVSAFMSGAMINAGVYGLFRCLGFFGIPDLWWACLLIALGAFSALLGILLAMVQKDIKRSLAYSSVENMGIVHLAAGFGLYAAVSGSTGPSLICFSAALLHLLNHSLYKPLLFMAAGSVLSCTGSSCPDELGGLQKKMPVVGCCFALGAASICALPPFNGFAGEFFLYLAMAVGGSQSEFSGLLYWGGLVLLSTVGGFTLLCFARLFGLTFLGEPRSAAARAVQKISALERAPQLLLCLLCLLSACAAPWLASLIATFVAPHLGLTGLEPFTLTSGPSQIFPIRLLLSVNGVFLVFLLFLGGLILLRRRLLRGRTTGESPTWDCGYADPSARMQYSGTSFAQPAAYFMRNLLGGQIRLPLIRDYFPGTAKAQAEFPDRIKEGFFRPLFLICLGLANWSKRIQHGRVNGYILYMLLVLVALLAWKVGAP